MQVGVPSAPAGCIDPPAAAHSAALAFGGAVDMISAAFRQAILLDAATDEMRGRLQGVFIVVVAGGIIGWNIAIPIYSTFFLAGDAVLSAAVAGASAEDAASLHERLLGLGLPH